MTDIAKAIAFAERCLKWNGVTGDYSGLHTFIRDADRVNELDLDSAEGLQEELQEFLDTRYFKVNGRSFDTRSGIEAKVIV
jgi:hypothetical protein